MDVKVELRKPLMSDARRYLEILSQPEFTYFPAKPASLKEEYDFIRRSKQLRKEGRQYDFAVIANKRHIGGAGIKVNEQYPHICEIGYFLDCKYWNKGIATSVVHLLEDFIAENLLDVIRIVVIAAKKNVASCKVALKSGYTKEGLMKKFLKVGDVYYDSCLYAKIVK